MKIRASLNGSKGLYLDISRDLLNLYFREFNCSMNERLRAKTHTDMMMYT